MNPTLQGVSKLRISTPRALWPLAAICIALFFATDIHATQVTNTTQAALASALSSGGTVTFGMDGRITLTNTLVIARDVTVDGSGHAIAISGGNTVRIFLVNPGINFTLKSLSVINGNVTGVNVTNTAYGGGIFNNGGNVLLTNCTLSGNTVTGYSGNFNNPGSSTAAGGAIFNQSGTLTLIRSAFITNSAVGGGAGWYTANGSPGSGGAIFNLGTLAVTNCLFISNSAFGGNIGGQPGDGDGGAIFNMGAATLAGSCINGNYVVSGVAEENGLGGDGPSGTAKGGGIYNSNTLYLLGNTLSRNMAIGTSASDNPGYGPLIAGDASGAGIFNSGSLRATNNTYFGNSATGGSNDRSGFAGVDSGGNGRGGAIFNQGGTAILAFQTIISNTAEGGTTPGGPTGASQGGGICATNGTVTLYNSIVASNASGGDFFAQSNAVTDGGNNLSSDASLPLTAPGSQNEVNPLLGPLTNNGGPTLTMLPQPGSPAIDAASGVSTTPFDQRGLARPFGSASDIGAVEYYPSYSIQGMVQHAPANQPVTVATGIFSTTTDAYGNYTLNSVPVGLYSVTPSAAGFIFAPASQSVVLGMNASNVNFAAYQLNALTLESYSNPVLKIAYAGTNGQSAVVQSSGTLSNWAPILTNTVGTNGIFEFQVTNTPAQPIQFFHAHSP